MTKTLQTALASLLIIGSFCSLGLFEYPLGQPRPHLSYLYTLTTWSYFMYSFYYSYILFDWYDTISGWKQLIQLITVIASILASFFYFKELKICLYELSVVDDTLETLGAPKEYQRLRNWTIRIIVGWIVYIFFYLAVHLY
ncbi:hypothetical protein ALC53_05089 [Atta colombica]|uniref:Uncharacterized protein n=1 Tax=Atta colombica TaxID=520822 RepID=A0A151I4K9_9HYME|nr:hypothetical protein ALC53_05089 [Atta colombica]